MCANFAFLWQIMGSTMQLCKSLIVLTHILTPC